MPKYSVVYPCIVYVRVSGVEAEDEYEALEKAAEDATLYGYCGNSAVDKLVGVDLEHVSVDIGSGEPLYTKTSMHLCPEVILEEENNG